MTKFIKYHASLFFSEEIILILCSMMHVFLLYFAGLKGSTKMGATEANTTLQARPETTSENIEALLDVRKEKKIICIYYCWV